MYILSLLTINPDIYAQNRDNLQSIRNISLGNEYIRVLKLESMNQRPTTAEYAPYYETYVSKVEGSNIVEILSNQLTTTLPFLKEITEAQWAFSYGPGKWTLKESWVHVIDAERVFAYRALRVARGDKTPLPGFNQDDFVPYSGANERNSASIIEEYAIVRQASLALFKTLTDPMWSQFGTASNQPVSPRGLAFIIAGHENHHLEITKSRYLSAS